MLVRDLSWYGGVVNFVSSLEANLSSNIKVTEFRIGQRKESNVTWLWPFMPFFDAFRLAYHVLFNRYDIVHINPSLNTKSLIRDAMFLLVLKLHGMRNIVVFMHGWEDRTALTIEKKAIFKKIFVALFGRVPVIYVLAQQFKRRLVAWGVDPCRVFVVTTMFDGRQFENVKRARKDDEIRMLFLSRFVKEKGVYELLEAFSALRDRFPGMTLILAGTGPEKEAMIQWVKVAGLSDCVTFPGYIRDKEKAQVLVDADVFVFPTYYGEGCPVSLLEAMAAGIPIITSKAGGISDFITDGKNGYLLDTVSTAEVEKAIVGLLTKPAARKAMGEYNREIAWRLYEASVVSKEIEAMYAKLSESI